MVVPKRFSANKLFPFNLNTQINLQKSSKGIPMDIEIDTLRDWSALLSSNNSREASVHSDVFSTKYAECIQALANNHT